LDAAETVLEAVGTRARTGAGALEEDAAGAGADWSTPPLCSQYYHSYEKQDQDWKSDLRSSDGIVSTSRGVLVPEFFEPL
jgi:hypothetical protein